MLSRFFKPSKFTELLFQELALVLPLPASNRLLSLFTTFCGHLLLYSVIPKTHLSQFQERFQYKQDIRDVVYILSHLFPVKPGKQWQTAFIKGRKVSTKSVATSCVVCPSKQVPPFKQTKSKHGCGTTNRNTRIF